jgi:hypothetical protein
VIGRTGRRKRARKREDNDFLARKDVIGGLVFPAVGVITADRLVAYAGFENGMGYLGDHDRALLSIDSFVIDSFIAASAASAA